MNNTIEELTKEKQKEWMKKFGDELLKTLPVPYITRRPPPKPTLPEINFGVESENNIRFHITEYTIVRPKEKNFKIKLLKHCFCNVEKPVYYEKCGEWHVLQICGPSLLLQIMWRFN